MPKSGNMEKGRGFRRKSMHVCDILSLIFAVNPMGKIQGQLERGCPEDREKSYSQTWKSVTGEQRSLAGPHLQSQLSSREEPQRTMAGNTQGGETSPGPKKVMLQGGSQGHVKFQRKVKSDEN